MPARGIRQTGHGIGLQYAYLIASVFTIAIVQFFAAHLFRSEPKRTRWISDFSAGVGLGYAFLYLIPKIGSMTAALQQRFPDVSGFGSQRLYVYMLIGFLAYYLIDFERKRVGNKRFGLATSVVVFSAYNCLIGISIVHIGSGVGYIYLIAAIVFSLHLFGVCHFLYKLSPPGTLTWARWCFVTALFLGGIIGSATEKYSHYNSVATALVGGVVLALSLRIKLPAVKLIDIQAFALGVTAVTLAVLLADPF